MDWLNDIPWDKIAFLGFFGWFVWFLTSRATQHRQTWGRRSRNTITLEMSGVVRERIITLGAQTGLTRIEVFRHALSTYEYIVQQRLDGATFYRNQTPMSFADEVPDNISEDDPEPVVIEPEPEPEEEEYEEDEDGRRTAWDRIR